MSVPGFDFDTGYGLIQADAAITTLLASSSVALTAAFSFSTSDLQVDFTDSSLDPDGGSISTWSWSFGDGNSSTAQNPMHVYANPGD